MLGDIGRVEKARKHFRQVLAASRVYHTTKVNILSILDRGTPFLFGLPMPIACPQDSPSISVLYSFSNFFIIRRDYYSGLANILIQNIRFCLNYGDNDNPHPQKSKEKSTSGWRMLWMEKGQVSRAHWLEIRNIFRRNVIYQSFTAIRGKGTVIHMYNIFY